MKIILFLIIYFIGAIYILHQSTKEILSGKIVYLLLFFMLLADAFYLIDREFIERISKNYKNFYELSKYVIPLTVINWGWQKSKKNPPKKEISKYLSIATIFIIFHFILQYVVD